LDASPRIEDHPAAREARTVSRMRCAWAVFVGVACLPGALRAEEDLALVRTDQGYRLERPDAAWRERPGPVPNAAHDALRLERAPGPAEVAFSVYQVDVPETATAETLIAGAAEGWRRQAVGPVAMGTSSVAGGAAPTMTWDMDRAGERLHIRQHFVVHAGMLHVLQCVAPAAAFADHAAAFAKALASFAFLPADPARSETRVHRRLAARCGSEVARARTWAEASERAKREKRLILVFFEQFRGLAIPPLANTTTFMDEDVVALCRERFVVLPWGDGVDAPFERPAEYGLGSHTFGQGVLFVTPDGKVAGGLGLLEPSLVEEAARATLARRP
jgi:hypothetical protein